jgi:hypothetical protein
MVGIDTDSVDCLIQEPHAIALNSAKEGEKFWIDGPGPRYENCQVVLDSPVTVETIGAYVAKHLLPTEALEFRNSVFRYSGGQIPHGRFIFTNSLFLLSFPAMPRNAGQRFTEIAESSTERFAFTGD